MRVRLKVLEGTGRGREVKIPRPKCFVGRGEDCYLRPNSELVSRRHCVIGVKDGRVVVRDLQSRNGTFVNGQRIQEARVLRAGDVLQVGPLVFELLIDHSLGGEKRAKADDVREVAKRTLSRHPDATLADDSNVSNWLADADRKEHERRFGHLAHPQSRADDGKEMSLQKAIEQRAEIRAHQEEETKEMDEHKIIGKLPKQADPVAKDSREAAAEALRIIFR